MNMNQNEEPSWMSCRTIMENSFGHRYILELKISTADHSDQEFQELMKPHEPTFVDLLKQIVVNILAPAISPQAAPPAQQRVSNANEEARERAMHATIAQQANQAPGGIPPR